MIVSPTHLIVTAPAAVAPSRQHGLRELATRMGARLGCAASAVAWLGGGQPTPREALLGAVKGGAHRIVVAPCLRRGSVDWVSLTVQVSEFAELYPYVQMHLAAPVEVSEAADDRLIERARAALAGPSIDTIPEPEIRVYAAGEPSDALTPGVAGLMSVGCRGAGCSGWPCTQAGAAYLAANSCTAIAAAAGVQRDAKMLPDMRGLLGSCRAQPVAGGERRVGGAEHNAPILRAIGWLGEGLV